jgi:hypothetical protein
LVVRRKLELELAGCTFKPEVNPWMSPRKEPVVERLFEQAS